MHEPSDGEGEAENHDELPQFGAVPGAEAPAEQGSQGNRHLKP